MSFRTLPAHIKTANSSSVTIHRYSQVFFASPGDLVVEKGGSGIQNTSDDYFAPFSIEPADGVPNQWQLKLFTLKPPGMDKTIFCDNFILPGSAPDLVVASMPASIMEVPADCYQSCDQTNPMYVIRDGDAGLVDRNTGGSATVGSTFQIEGCGAGPTYTQVRFKFGTNKYLYVATTPETMGTNELYTTLRRGRLMIGNPSNIADACFTLSEIPDPIDSPSVGVPLSFKDHTIGAYVVPECGCANGGVCTNGGCSCVGGYTGDTCMTAPPAVCPTCQHGGTCSDPATGCVCIAGYTGTSCETAPAAVCPTCQNGGTCSDPATGCVCPETHMGTLCETSRNPGCPDCKNGGTCVELVGACVCIDGYTGTTCEVPPGAAPPPPKGFTLDNGLLMLVVGLFALIVGGLAIVMLMRKKKSKKAVPI